MLSTSTSASQQFHAHAPANARGHAVPGKATGRNPLTDLIQTEKAYLGTLKIIDSQIAPIWMKQMTSAAPDFSELLKYVHGILKVNKRFCTRLMKVAADPGAMKELGDVLMQWIDDMEVPYANYSRSYVKGLNDRKDIAENPPIQLLLENLSANVLYDITLELLFDAPLQRLAYYKSLYNRLLESTRPGRPDHSLLLDANKRLDTIIQMSRNRSAIATSAHLIPDVLSAKTSRFPLDRAGSELSKDTGASNVPHAKPQVQNLEQFMSRVNCSQVVDAFSKRPMRYQLKWASPNTRLLMNDSFTLIPEREGADTFQVRLALTTNELAIFKEESVAGDGLVYSERDEIIYWLMYPPFPVNDVSGMSMSISHELAGEYLMQLLIQRKVKITLKADTKAIRNTWLGAEIKAPSATTLKPRSMALIVEKCLSDSKEAGPANNQREPPSAPSERANQHQEVFDGDDTQQDDIYSFYTDNSRESVQTTESVRERREAFRDTIMDFYDRRFSEEDEPEMPNNYLRMIKELDDSANDKGTNNTSKSSRNTADDDDDDETLDKLKPRSVKVLPRVPETSSAEAHVETSVAEQSNSISTKEKAEPATVEPREAKPKEDMKSAPVQMTYIAPVVAHKMVVASDHQPLSEAPDEEGLTQSEQDRPDTPTSPYKAPDKSSVSGPVTANAVTSVRSALSDTRSSSISEGLSNQAIKQTTERHGSHVGASQVPSRSTSKPADSKGVPVYKPLPRTSSIRANQTPTVAQARPLHVSTDPYELDQRPGIGVHPLDKTASPPAAQAPRPSISSYDSSSNSYYNGNGPQPSGSMSTASTVSSQHSIMSPRPPRVDSQGSNLSGLDELASPPLSPGAYANATKQILYSHGQCEVFHWKDETWYAADGKCGIQVRLTNANRACVTIQLQKNGQLYLNAWILPTTVIQLLGDSDVSLTLYMGTQKENYLVHFESRADAAGLANILLRMHDEAVQVWEAAGGGLNRRNSQTSIATASNNSVPSAAAVAIPRSSSLDQQRASIAPGSLTSLEDQPQTLTPLMQCKCKLFAQQEHSSWNSFGSVVLRISQQLPSKKMHVYMENGKTTLVSAIVLSYNVERTNPKRITFLLHNEQSRTSMVYMINLKDEKTTNKIYEYIKTRNAQNGW